MRQTLFQMSTEEGTIEIFESNHSFYSEKIRAERLNDLAKVTRELV